MEITPPMIQNIGWVTFLVFALFNVLSIPIIYMFYPETANKTLEELDVVFSSKSCFVWRAKKEPMVQTLKADNDPLAKGLDEKKPQEQWT
jgi:hypothetical protein